MKHENSNASTATTTSSSATTPPTPEINGNIPNNNNNYQENFNHFQNYQQSPMPPQNTQIAADISSNSSTNQQLQPPSEINLQQQLQQPQQSIIPPAVNTWNPQHYSYPPQAAMTANYQPTNEMANNNPATPLPVVHHQHHHSSPVTTNNGEYYAEQYTHGKYEQIQVAATVTPPTIVPNHYETWVSYIFQIKNNR
jgi:hypothetical protein